MIPECSHDVVPVDRSIDNDSKLLKALMPECAVFAADL